MKRTLSFLLPVALLGALAFHFFLTKKEPGQEIQNLDTPPLSKEDARPHLTETQSSEEGASHSLGSGGPRTHDKRSRVDTQKLVRARQDTENLKKRLAALKPGKSEQRQGAVSARVTARGISLLSSSPLVLQEMFQDRVMQQHESRIAADYEVCLARTQLSVAEKKRVLEMLFEEAGVYAEMSDARLSGEERLSLWKQLRFETDAALKASLRAEDYAEIAEFRTSTIQTSEVNELSMLFASSQVPLATETAYDLAKAWKRAGQYLFLVGTSTPREVTQEEYQRLTRNDERVLKTAATFLNERQMQLLRERLAIRFRIKNPGATTSGG